MTAASLILEVEAAAYRCWPAKEMEEYDGWQLRYADGFSRRGNSVYPAGSSEIELGEKLDRCREWYIQRGLDLVIRQTPATEPGLDDALEAMGFTAEGRTAVMTAELQPGARGRSAVATAPTEAWYQTMAGLWGIGADRVEAWRGIVDRITLPAGYGLVGGATAAGLAVVAGEWVGLFEIIVRAEDRRQRIGRDLTQSLLAWGADNGARFAFLQVVADNGSAIAFYESLGFQHAYLYWYRRSPVTNK